MRADDQCPGTSAMLGSCVAHPCLPGVLRPSVKLRIFLRQKTPGIRHDVAVPAVIAQSGSSVRYECT
jgi:hypothetical protein